VTAIRREKNGKAAPRKWHWNDRTLPITKMIAHLPLAFLQRESRPMLLSYVSVWELHIARCFPGESPRRRLSWCRGLFRLFSYITPTPPNSSSHLVPASLFDDGRSYLERSTERYDVIVPGSAAAGGGCRFQPALLQGVLRQRQAAFAARRHSSTVVPHGWRRPRDHRVGGQSSQGIVPLTFAWFHSVEGWGYHFLASSSPLPHVSGLELANRMPAAATADLN